jgi:hypothetical protein
LFYQGCDTFFFDGMPQQDQEFKLPWDKDVWVHNPYVTITEHDRCGESFSQYVGSKGCKHTDNLAHYGADAQDIWAEYLSPYLQHKINRLP